MYNLSIKSNETAQFKHEIKRIKKFANMLNLSAAKWKKINYELGTVPCKHQITEINS